MEELIQRESNNLDIDDYSIFSESNLKYLSFQEKDLFDSLRVNNPPDFDCDNPVFSKINAFISTKDEKLRGLLYKKLSTKPPNESPPFSSDFKFSEENCTKCYATLVNKSKFVCSICPLTKLCSKCEVSHLHPMIKLKSSDTATVSQTKSLLLMSLKPRSKYEYLRSECLSANILPIKNKVVVCPNQKFIIPLKIFNSSKFDLPESTILMVKNNQELLVDNFSFPNSLEKNGFMTVELLGYSTSVLKEYTLEFFLYDYKTKIKCNIAKVRVEVRRDTEEEYLNSLFMNYPKILELDKIKKRMLNELMIKGIVSGVEEAYSFMSMRSFSWKGAYVHC